MAVVVTGSLAYDYIMSFPGYFTDHILPDQLHMLSVSFLVDSMRRQRGGCAANIAYSHIDAQAVKFGIDPEFFSSSHIHLHVPEGATPKDGPSAGITLATALVSLASGRNIDRPLAMTGELTLTGQVLPVGGIREKVVAAKRARIAELILPEANRRDFDELPDYLRDGMKVHFVRQFSEIPPIVFAPAGRSRS